MTIKTDHNSVVARFFLGHQRCNFMQAIRQQGIAAEARFHAATSSLDSLMAISASSLKQKLLLKKAEEELEDALKAKEVC